MTAIIELRRNGALNVASANTLARRIMLAREDKGLRQNQLVDILRSKPYNIDISYPGYSKIESGITQTPRHEILIAISEVLEVSLDELIAGKPAPEIKPTAYFSPEAEEVANIVDKLDNDTKKIVVSLAHQLLEIDTERRALHSEMYELLQNNEGAIRDSDKPLAKSVLRQMGQHRTLSTGKR